VVPPTVTSTTVVPPTVTATPVVQQACTVDGVCLTSLTVNPAAPRVGGSTLLTTTANRNVGPTIWVIEIVDASNSLLKSCASGTSCSVTVSSSAAVTKSFKAYLVPFWRTATVSTDPFLGPVSVTWG
jgi:hypothetical protein